MKLTDLLMIVAVIAVVFASVNLMITVNKIKDIKSLTGFVASIGTANLTIETSANVNFTTNNIDWGSGMVDVGETLAYLDTKAGTVTNGNWTANAGGFVLENIGNVNVSLDIKAGKSAATFVGGTSPDYEWLFENNESVSCQNSTGGADGIPLDAMYDVNTTGDGTRVCDVFQYLNSNNTINIHINLTIPYNSLKGAKGDIITATATA